MTRALMQHAWNNRQETLEDLDRQRECRRVLLETVEIARSELLSEIAAIDELRAKIVATLEEQVH